MTILAYKELCELIEQGVITNVTKDMVNSASIDVTLGGMFLKESPFINDIFIGDRQSLRMDKYYDTVKLKPNEFCLASIQQRLYLPDDISAVFMLKSSPARQGLEQLTACWIDAGYYGNITLELKNMTQYSTLWLKEGDPIGQLVFHRHAIVPEHASYRNRGKYNGDLFATQIKKA